MIRRKKISKKSDKRKNVTKQPKGNVFHPQWMHSDYLEYWLSNFTIDGSLLNVCSGQSMLGQVRVDIDPESNRTMHGDLFNIKKLFKPNSFDYIYCDPPFRIYTAGDNRFNWQFDLFSLCRIALITKRPKVTVNMPSVYHSYKIFEDSRPSLTVMRIDYK